MTNNTEVIDGWGSLAQLAPWLKAAGVQKVLVISMPDRRFVPEVSEALSKEGLVVEVFDGATVHVPKGVVEQCERVMKRTEAQALVTVGGGSATGLAKALRLRHDLPFVAIPTTYAGSERTEIYGISDGDSKQTGRDPKVRPDAVVLDPMFTASMPLQLTVKSLINALAHPISALSTGELQPGMEQEALAAIRDLVWTLEQLLEAPQQPEARAATIRLAGDAASILDRASLGLHHRVAHSLGGRFRTDHAGLHSVILPHFVRHLALNDAEKYERIVEASGHRDLPAVVFDALRRVEAPTSLSGLGISLDQFVQGLREDELLRSPWVEDAFLGRRASVDTRRVPEEGRPDTSERGPALAEADSAVICLHGRGDNADSFLSRVENIVGHDADVALIAPQSPGIEWYAGSYRTPDEAMAQGSLDAVARVLDRVLQDVPPEKVFLSGFSQGACLAIRLFATRGENLGGLVALSGADLGGDRSYSADLEDIPVLLGVSENDPWVSASDVDATADKFREAGADVHVLGASGDAHEMTVAQRAAALSLLSGEDLDEGEYGFGNAHESEALDGALPHEQNTPREQPYGLHAELVSGTGFVASRRENQRVWLYRVRPSAQHTPLVPIEHRTFTTDFQSRAVDPNLAAWKPLPMPEEPTDFVDGMVTIGGAGDAALRRGFAIHVYAANRSMEHRAFYNADGDFLIVPQEGRMLLQTECGYLQVEPGEIAIMPRGLKFSVHVIDGQARGYVGEVYGRHFELPERGPVGSNGLADPRHFRAPRAAFEDRMDPGYRITAKMSGNLFEATQDFVPYDVAAWHGNYTPYVYDLMMFAPVGYTRFDHVDPSVYIVVSAPLDEQGANSLDFVFFPPRWDVSEHSFRPPFFHRNVTTEINGIIQDPSLRPDGPFEAGMTFITPSHTAHGVIAKAVERAYDIADSVADAPHRVPDTSAWFQFETTLPMRPTEWAETSELRMLEWPLVWGSYRKRFDPRG